VRLQTMVRFGWTISRDLLSRLWAGRSRGSVAVLISCGPRTTGWPENRWQVGTSGGPARSDPRRAEHDRVVGLVSRVLGSWSSGRYLPWSCRHRRTGHAWVWQIEHNGGWPLAGRRQHGLVTPRRTKVTGRLMPILALLALRRRAPLEACSPARGILRKPFRSDRVAARLRGRDARLTDIAAR